MVDLEHAYATVSPRIARAYRLLSTLPVADFDAGLVIGSGTMPQSAAAPGLRKLADTGLLLRTGEHPVRGEVYAFGPVAREHARRLGRSCDETGPPLSKLATWMVSNAAAVSELVTPGHARRSHSYAKARHRITFATPHDALQWLESHHRNCMTLLHAAAAAGLHECVWQLVLAMWPAWRQYRRYADWIHAHELAARAANACEESDAYLVLTSTLGVALRSTGRHDEALDRFEDALALSRWTSDERMTARVLHEIGSTHLALGHLADARQSLARSRQLSVQTQSWRDVALTDIVHARIDMSECDPITATTRLTQAGKVLTEAGDSYDAGRARAYLSRAYSLAGDFASARFHGRRAHEAFRVGAPHPWAARSLEFLGLTEQDADNPAAARALLDEALAAYELLSTADAERLRPHLAQLA